MAKDIEKLLKKYENESDEEIEEERADNTLRNKTAPAPKKREKDKKIKLDLKDFKILKQLDENARSANSEIAKKVRLNKNTVNYKIKRMEEEGVIKGYYPVIDNSKLGYFSFRIYLKFFNLKPEDETEMIQWLKEKSCVGVIARIESGYDLAFMVWVKNIYEFEDFWTLFKEKFRKSFWREKVDVFSKVFYFKRDYLLEETNSRDYETVGERKTVSFDELDMKILLSLSKNARISVVELSEKLKTPPRTIAFRIAQLEKKKIIQGYRVEINLETINYEYYKINIILNDFYDFKKVFSFCLNNSNIIYLDRTLSDLDFEIDAEVNGRKELLKLQDKIKSEFSVRDIEILNFREYYKLELLPDIN